MTSFYNPPSRPNMNLNRILILIIWGIMKINNSCTANSIISSCITCGFMRFPLFPTLSHHSLSLSPCPNICTPRPLSSIVKKPSHILSSVRAGGKPQVDPAPPLGLASVPCTQIPVATGHVTSGTPREGLWSGRPLSFWWPGGLTDWPFSGLEARGQISFVVLELFCENRNTSPLFPLFVLYHPFLQWFFFVAISLITFWHIRDLLKKKELGGIIYVAWREVSLWN